MKLRHKLSIFLLILMFSVSGQAPHWPESNRESKPWTRWWWPGNAVDKANIKRELNEMAAAGIGGVEITSIYGVKGEEERFIDYLSPEFSEMIEFTIAEAAHHGMGVDLPPGSGWRLGGPFVPEDKGLWSLKMFTYKLNEGEEWKASPDLENVVLASFVSETGEIDVLSPTEKFTSPAGGKLYVASRQSKGDKVKRASEGGKGPAIDTFNEEITSWYLNEFNKRLNIQDSLIRCYFHDSFEYTGDFTTRFTEEFEKRRGYNLAEYLHILSGDSDDNETIERVRSDYRQTLGELVLESFIMPMTRWANEHGSLNRNQAHGSPGNVLDLYAACDIPETEIFGKIEPGTVDIFVNKFASSAAHITGQNLVSAESFTWLDEHWTVTPADMIRATNRLLLSGVNHMIFHGTCYSPADAEWPGWLFYASAQINNRNPLWPALPSLFNYIERSQSILQKALPQNDLLVYWPYYDVIAKEGDRLYFSLNIDKGDKASWFNDYPLAALSRELMDEGYNFDYISDRQLLNCKVIDGRIVTEGGAVYEAVVLPEMKYIPSETLNQLASFVSADGKVFFSNALPESVPGMSDINKKQHLPDSAGEIFIATEKINEILTQHGIDGEKAIREKGFHYLKMKLDDEMWYMVMNCTEEAKDEWVHLGTAARSYLFYNPEQGAITMAASDNNKVRIQLEPERALFIRCTNRKTDVADNIYVNNSYKPVVPEGYWKIKFIDGGPVYPGDISTDKLVSWTELGDANTARFAGTAGYSMDFIWNDSINTALLNLGKVYDCVSVKLNGKDYGTLPGPLFKVVVDNLVQGRNSLELKVTNVAANRIRDLDLRRSDWKKFYDINFVNIDYQPFDASQWKLREAGLTGKIELTPIYTKE